MEKDEEKFFYEDEVAMVSPKSGLVKYGLVLTTNRSRSETELKKSTYKSPNEIKVIWHPNGTEEIISDDKVVLMDRSLMPGDVVRKVNDGKPSQFGYCENIDIYATVKILNTNKIIENINSRSFTHTKPFAIDSSVFYESWVGGIYDVKCKVTFASQDGSIFTLDDPFRQDFISLSTSDSFSIDDNVFYHGQKLKMSLDSIENAKFISISNLMYCLLQNFRKKFNHKFSSKWVKVYVQDITVTSVEVEWYCQTSSRTKPREEHWPERIITGDNLKKLKTIDLFESCSIQVGDTHWYKIKNSDSLITMKQWRAKCTEDFNTEPGPSPSKIKKDHIKLQSNICKKHEKKNKNPFESEDLADLDNLLCVQNVSNRNVSTIQIQRTERLLNREFKCLKEPKPSEHKPSTSTMGNSSIHKLKSNRLKRNRLRKSLVKKSKQFHIPKVSTKSNSKVVVEICFTKSVIDVIWQDGTKETGLSSTDLYPVQTLDDLEFFPGDFVTEKNPALDVYGVIESVDHAERTALVQWFKVHPENPSLPNPIEKTDFSVYDLRDHPDFHFKSGCLIIHISPDTNPDLNTLTAGQVLSVGTDGRILVMWVNGEKTKCWPQELFVVKLHDEDGFSFQDEEYDDDDDDNDDDDAPLAINDDLSELSEEFEDWMSFASPTSSNKSPDQEIDEALPPFFQVVKRVVNKNVKTFLDAIEHKNQPNNLATILSNSLDQIESGFLNFRYSPYMLTPEIKNFERLIKDFKINVKNICPRKDDNVEAEVELSNEPIRKDTRDKIKKLVMEFSEKFNRILISSKPNKNEDQSKNNDLSMDVMDIVEPTPELPLTELDSTECDLISMDTDPVSEYEVIAKPEEAGVFEMVDTLVDSSHKYINEIVNMHSTMMKTITKDIQILQKSLPAGIWVKTFEDRMDLFSIMIRGPEKTPYAGGLFMFDVKLPHTYPLQPPLCHYYSFCDDRLNPNLYEDGKVCLSLLGTWSGHGVELWSPKDSNLLQLLVSIQGLILVNEPYYNEAGFESQRGQKLAKENSRVYNEMVLIKVVQSMTNILTMNYSKIKNGGYFKNEILEHVKSHGPKLINTIEHWIKISERELTEDEKLVPGYPLLPLSKGFCLSINKALKDYKEVLISMNIMFK